MINATTLAEVAQVARRQREGGYTTESDALTALMLIETMARLIAGAAPEASPTPADPNT